MTRSSARCSSGSYSHPILCLPWSEIVDKWHWMGWRDRGWILWEIRFQKQKTFWKYVNFSMEASNKPLSWPGHPNSASHLSLNLMTPACCMSNSGFGPQRKFGATVSRVDLVLCFTSMKTIPIATLPINLLYDVLRPTLLTMNPKIYTSNPPMSDRKGAWNTVGIATPKRTAKNPYAGVGVQCCTLVAEFLISSVSFRFMTITGPSHLLNLSGQLWLYSGPIDQSTMSGSCWRGVVEEHGCPRHILQQRRKIWFVVLIIIAGETFHFNRPAMEKVQSRCFQEALWSIRGCILKNKNLPIIFAIMA